MKINPIKICREPWSKNIQHLPAVKLLTRAAIRKLRHETKLALKKDQEPPINGSGGERY
jgi:hypothetical protein